MQKKKAPKTPPTDPKPAVTLSGGGDNAYLIFAACRRAARKAGWDGKRFDAFLAEAKAGDYDHALSVVMQHFDVS